MHVFSSIAYDEVLHIETTGYVVFYYFGDAIDFDIEQSYRRNASLWDTHFLLVKSGISTIQPYSEVSVCQKIFDENG